MNIILGKSTLREWRWDDKISLIKNANNIKIARMVKDRFPYPYEENDADEWLRDVVGERPQTNLAIAIKDKTVGAISFQTPGDIYKRSAEIGYWLGEKYWGKGIMTEVVTAVTAYAFENFDLCRLYAGVFATNLASARVLEKSGYQFEGCLKKSITKHEQTFDQFLFAKII